jgi:hypothetical protein
MSVTDSSDGNITVVGLPMSVTDSNEGDVTVTGVPYECY